MTAVILRGDARNLPLPDQSVDLIVTSPPYFALRSYTDGGEHYAGQIGSEATPAEYIAALLDCTREWVRVLKPSGSLFVNLGDKYANDTKWGGTSGQRHLADAPGTGYRGKRSTGFPSKSLMGLPWRYALGCIDDLGLILRAELIWSKPNGLPESVTDRVRRSHEQWFHFTRLPRYFAAVDEIREAYEPDSARRKQLYGNNPGRDGLAGLRATGAAQHGSNGVSAMGVGGSTLNPLGKLPGSVWDIPSEPLTVPAHLGVDHFAAFPTEWPRRIILGWSPSGVCTACGEGRRPTVDASPMVVRPSARRLIAQASGNAQRTSTSGTVVTPATRAITGYVCACPEPTAATTPAVVLDPFGGTGTTALVASALGRTGITIDYSADYNRIAQWRTTNRAQIAKVLDLPKPPTQIVGQQDLFTSMEGIPA